MVGSYLGSCVHCAVALKANPLCMVREGAENGVCGGALLLEVYLCQGNACAVQDRGREEPEKSN